MQAHVDDDENGREDDEQQQTTTGGGGRRRKQPRGHGRTGGRAPSRLTLSGAISRLSEPDAQRARHLLTRLKQELKKLGHNGFVREDSQLAISFIMDRLDRNKWNLRSVATEIYRTSRLYEETNFADLSHGIVEDVVENCAQLVAREDRSVVRRAAVHFMVPALKSVYMQLFSLMDAYSCNSSTTPSEAEPSPVDAHLVIDLRDDDEEEEREEDDEEEDEEEEDDE